MARSKKQRDLIPEHFKSIEEAGEFWDNHDLADYWDQTSEASFEVDLQRRLFLTALEPELAKRLADRAHKQGVSTETLINVWLGEKLAEEAPAPPKRGTRNRFERAMKRVPRVKPKKDDQLPA